MVLFESAGHYEVNNKQLNITVQLSHKLLSQKWEPPPNYQFDSKSLDDDVWCSGNT